MTTSPTMASSLTIDPFHIVSLYQTNKFATLVGAWFDFDHNCFCPLTMLLLEKASAEVRSEFRKTKAIKSIKLAAIKLLGLPCPFLDGFIYGYDSAGGEGGTGSDYCFRVAVDAKHYSGDAVEFERGYKEGEKNGRAVWSAVRAAKVKIFDAGDLEG